MVKEFAIEDTKALLYGSLILGGGGGGGLSTGQYSIDQAFSKGKPTIVDINSLDTESDGIIITTSAVGAPAAIEQYVTADDYNHTVDLMKDKLSEPLLAFITNEIGAGSTFNAFIQSATTGIPMLDAACNGRAHPLGTQGSMGLSSNPEYRTIQTAVGGNPATNKYTELTVSGSVKTTSRMVRVAADEAGGLVVVARNPIDLEYVKDNAAIGAISRAIEVGEAYLSGETSRDKIIKAVENLGGKIEVEGTLDQFQLETVGGLDKGVLTLNKDQSTYQLFICNEYMALDIDGSRVSTFPDLLMTFDTQSGLPVTSAELKLNQDITIISVPKDKILLGSGMFEKSGYEAIEELINIKLVDYNLDIIK